MTEFAYQAKDQNGNPHEGVVEAASKSIASSQLRNRGWVVISIRSQGNSDEGSLVSTAESSAGKLASQLGLGKILSVHLETSLQQLALMIRSGMTLLASIEAVSRQAPSIKLRRVWRVVAADLQRGQGFHVAMKNHRCFPDFVVKLVEVGEKTGNLEGVLRRASTNLTQRRKARDEFWSATIYPALVILMAILVTVYMVVYLIPKLENYLQSLGKELPAMTQSLISATTWLTEYFLIVVIVVVALFAMFMIFYSSQDGKKLFDRLLLRIPLIGRMISLSETTTFAQTLSMMLASGITLTEGLGATRSLLRNRYLAELVDRAKDKIMRGGNLGEALNQPFAFTPMLYQMVSVGQQSGEMESVLAEVAELHEEQFQLLVKRLNAMLTPTLTLLIGGIVGYVYIAFFLALFAAGS